MSVGFSTSRTRTTGRDLRVVRSIGGELRVLERASNKRNTQLRYHINVYHVPKAAGEISEILRHSTRELHLSSPSSSTSRLGTWLLSKISHVNDISSFLQLTPLALGRGSVVQGRRLERRCVREILVASQFLGIPTSSDDPLLRF